MKRLSFALSLLIAVSTAAQTVAVAPATPVARFIQSQAGAASHDVDNFYAPAGYQPVWTRNGRPTAQAQAVIATLEHAATKGLDPSDYGSGQWAARVAALRGDAAIAAFDVDLTKALMRYATDVRIGRVHPSEVSIDLDAAARMLYLPALVGQVAAAADAAAASASIEPRLDQYRRIEAESKQDAPLPIMPKLVPGVDYEGLAQLASVLQRHGDLASDVKVNGTRYEGAVVDAVKRFQARHVLDADGIIGRTTFAQLNAPAASRVEQLELALERWRWIAAQADGPSIIVNIPEFKLRASDGDDELTMRVVVGKAAGHRTPVFDGDIKHVVFRPSWSVPPNIQRNEILPKIANNPGYLARNHYELVDNSGRAVGSHVDGDTIRRIKNGSLRVRQKPGTHNALGLVKFLFPNDNHVYLHSTPQQALFERTRRDFSHGCIRVEDPAALAAWVLRAQPQWSSEKIAAAMTGKRDDVYVKVERPISVVLFYATAVVEDDGAVKFLDDIYGHDVQLAKALAPAQPNGAVMVAAK
ncbi:MAG TPA: L,D-transpeptidase family protein [Thermoanaerobaculia bacterium]|nr:L,D-transpeptidase family protein [Thermoanaerobaculia bacterium]